MKILYVEDNPANLSLLQRIARMGGHEVITYTEGESALTNFEKDKPDLVLMDVQLAGGLSGLDVVRQLRARGHRMPIVAVTAYAMTGDRDRCIEAGCDTYIAKPLPVSELVDLVGRYDAQMKTAQSAAQTPVIKPLTKPLTPPAASTPAPSSESKPAPAPAVVSPAAAPAASTSPPPSPSIPSTPAVPTPAAPSVPTAPAASSSTSTAAPPPTAPTPPASVPPLTSSAPPASPIPSTPSNGAELNAVKPKPAPEPAKPEKPQTEITPPPPQNASVSHGSTPKDKTAS